MYTDHIMRVSIFTGADYAISCFRYADCVAHEFQSMGIAARVYTIERRRGLAGLYDKYIGYPLLARANQGDINVLASESTSILIPFLDRSRSVIVCHDTLPLILQLHSANYRFRYRIMLRLMGLARGVLAVSETTKHNLANHIPSIPQSRVIARHQGLHEDYSGVDRDKRRRQFREKHCLGDGFVVFHIGNASWHKNFRGVLEGFSQANVPHARLLKVGPIGEADQRRIAELNMADSIVNISYVDDEELADAYMSSDVLAFPSYGEGFGIPPLEAMSIGLPVIASTRESMPEIGGDAVLYAEPDDYEAIGDAIRRLSAEETLRSSLVHKGLQRAKLFDWKNVAEGILSFFPDLSYKSWS